MAAAAESGRKAGVIPSLNTPKQAMSRIRIPAAWMRGGTSKGLFFLAADLPAEPAARDALLVRAIGSPDPYGKQIDGVGGATSSTSKVVIVSPSQRSDCDVDYLFGQVPVGGSAIDWSGNCGNLTAAVGPFAIERGLLACPRDGIAMVRIWQANIGKHIIAHVPMHDGAVREDGDFLLDGVAFASAPIRLEFLSPGGGALFPAGGPITRLAPDGQPPVEATLINAAIPLVLVEAAALGADCAASQAQLNRDAALLARCEALRVAGAVAMGLAGSSTEAAARGHTPKIALLAPPQSYVAADGRHVEAGAQDLTVRVLSMGVVHHAIPGTAAIGLATAASIPGTLAARQLRGPVTGLLRIGHPSGRVEVGVSTRCEGGEWRLDKAEMQRSARLLMDGVVCVPGVRA